MAAYIYKKLDPNKPASWGNSGAQRLLVQVLDNPSKEANSWFSSLDPALLPDDVCGAGWAIQQDKAKVANGFSFPDDIPQQVDNIGWPPLYDAKHTDLSALMTVPLCAGAEASLTITPATCTAPEKVVLGATSHAAWGALDRVSGPGSYTVTATADPGYRFADDSTAKTFSGTLAGVLPKSDPSCAPPPKCIPNSSVSYTYDPARNSGVITVPNPANSTGELCRSFWVTAASWKYLGSSQWAQKIDVVDKLGEISTPGDYPYTAPVTCGQGDIYASYDGADATLDPGPYLWGPDNPFDEKFLHEMGFTGPRPTYTTTELGCNEVTAEPSTTPPTCTAAGQYTLPDVDKVTWWVDGVETEPGTYTVKAGTKVTVVARATEGTVLKGGVQDPRTLLWSYTWKLDFPKPECQSPELTGQITAICENDVPWISYTVTLVDPDHQSTGDTAELTFQSGSDSFTFIPALGTIHDGETLSGRVLWPGAAIDGDGDPIGWPGWSNEGGVWHEIDGNYAWTRDGVTAIISVNPSISDDLEYPSGNPYCNPGPTVIEPTLSSVPATCDATTSGTFTLPDIEGIVWKVDGVVTEPGTYSGGTPSTKIVTAELDQSDGPVVLAPGAQTRWELEFTAPKECLTIEGSTATGECLADSPWIFYTITLTDPYNQASDHDADIIMTDGTNTVTLPLGTVPPSGVLTGKVLWPGASVDPDTGEANGWPGWVQVDGEWTTTTDPAHYGWTRVITTATLSVNPEMQVDLTYPPATPDCNTNPPEDPPTYGIFPTSAVLAQQCTTDGRGVLTLGQVDGVSFFEDVNYFIDGVPATSSTVYLRAGTYEVTVTTKSPNDGLQGATAWRVTVTGAQVCGELETLALTGADAGVLLALGGILVAAGAAAAVTARVRMRRAE
ncbi:hypothetical protein [Protaetiibacter intestinalis]|uniref:hypothetical protein n=1 Tax=Protaetiibacter intestinalis TaxID=2419774 RepID=UPI001300AF7B|nr:hypothetical protein [Protaetiibacter intestinalis]